MTNIKANYVEMSTKNCYKLCWLIACNVRHGGRKRNDSNEFSLGLILANSFCACLKFNTAFCQHMFDLMNGSNGYEVWPLTTHHMASTLAGQIVVANFFISVVKIWFFKNKRAKVTHKTRHKKTNHNKS